MTITVNNPNEITEAQAHETIVMHNDEAFTFYDAGCSRWVFVNENKTRVVKVEKHELSQENAKEADIYASVSEHDRARMAVTALESGLIVQEFVLPAKWGGIKMTMEQIQFSRACRGEVGWKDNDDGTKRLVCFDLDEYLKY